MRNKSLFIKLIASFVAILVITMTIFYMVLEFKVFNEFEKEIVKTNTSKLTAVQNNVENMLETIDKTVLNLSFEPKLNKLQKITTIKNNNTEHIFLISDIIDSLIASLKTNDSISSILLYAEPCDYVFSSNKEFEKSDRFEYNEWITEFKKTNSMAIYTVTANSKSDYNNIVTFVYPLSKFATSLDGAVAVNVSLDYIDRNILSRPNSSENTILVFDDAKKMVLSHNSLNAEKLNETELIEKIDDTKKDEGYIYTKCSGKRCIAIYIKSDMDQWTFVDIYPMEAFMNQTSALRYTIIITIIALILFGLFASYILSAKIYLPIKELMNKIKGYGNYTQSNNEVEMISDALDSMMQQNKDISVLLDNNRAYIRNTFVENLLEGIETTEENYKMMGIEFKKYHCCCLISIDKYDMFAEKYEGQQRYHMKMLICDVCDKAFDENIKCYAVVGKKDKIFLLISLNEKTNTNELIALEECFIQVKAKIKDLTGFSVTVTLGNFVTEIALIKQSYHEAVEAVKFRMIAGYDSIIPIWQYKYNENSNYFYPHDEEKHLFNQLLVNDEEGVRKALNKFFEAFRNKSDLSYNNILYIYNQLLSSAIKFFNDNKFSHSYVLQEYSSRIKEDLDNNILDEINQHICDLFVGINQMNNQNERYISKVIEYIENHYKTDIDVNTLADSVGISYSHLRKIFRENMGTNLNSFINKRRIKEAKILLKETDMTIYDMAVALGYNSDQTFTRFFKKYEGTTPGAYRSAVRTQDNK